MNTRYWKNIISSFLLIFFLFGGAIALAQAEGTYNFQEQSGLSTSGNTAGYDVFKTTSVEDLIGQVIFLGLSFIGIAFFAFMLYGGLTWMTARDNEEKVKKAMDIVIASILGIIVTLAAYGISYFLIQYFASSNAIVS